jgi:hypothetical protein
MWSHFSFFNRTILTTTLLKNMNISYLIPNMLIGNAARNFAVVILATHCCSVMTSNFHLSWIIRLTSRSYFDAVNTDIFTPLCTRWSKCQCCTTLVNTVKSVKKSLLLESLCFRLREEPDLGICWQGHRYWGCGGQQSLTSDNSAVTGAISKGQRWTSGESARVLNAVRTFPDLSVETGLRRSKLCVLTTGCVQRHFCIRVRWICCCFMELAVWRNVTRLEVRSTAPSDGCSVSISFHCDVKLHQYREWPPVRCLVIPSTTVCTKCHAQWWGVVCCVLIRRAQRENPCLIFKVLLENVVVVQLVKKLLAF